MGRSDQTVWAGHVIRDRPNPDSFPSGMRGPRYEEGRSGSPDLRKYWVRTYCDHKRLGEVLDDIVRLAGESGRERVESEAAGRPSWFAEHAVVGRSLRGSSKAFDRLTLDTE